MSEVLVDAFLEVEADAEPVACRQNVELALELGLVDLFEALSHLSLSEDLKRLSLRDWGRQRRHRSAPDSEGSRRPFGSVSDAVAEVLRRAGSEPHYIEVYQAVEELLEGPLARSSVKNALVRGCSGRRPLFERVGRGRYRLHCRTAESSR